MSGDVSCHQCHCASCTGVSPFVLSINGERLHPFNAQVEIAKLIARIEVLERKVNK